MDGVVRWYLRGLVLLGILIHLFALFGFTGADVSPRIHVVMLVIDVAVFSGLCLASRWGYWLAGLLFVQQGVCQSYWTYEAVKFQLDHPVLQGATAVLCVVAFALLLAYRSAVVIR